MRATTRVGLTGFAILAFAGCQTEEAPGSAAGDTAAADRLNPMISLHEADAPVFGLYAPRPTASGGSEASPPEARTPAERAAETIEYTQSDYVFHSAMEGGVDEALPDFREFVGAMHEGGASARTHPFVVKMEKISEDPDAAEHVHQQLNAGVSGVMFVHVESAEELRTGLDAMRFTSNGGTRPEDDLGMAPDYWGVSAEEYRAKADLWPLNPDGELLSWVIIESREGLENIREIAAVPGIGVLWPGAGTLRGVFSTTGPDGSRVVDEEAWEGAIQTVLDACEEFDLLCGFPAGPDDIESRMAQGFDVFVMGWGDAGFETVEMGHAIAGR
ncbi:MAG: aldolase/citrate lyase family protein [Gemmatimonadota bacterium]|nr:aldolase/citrate lyase family protein [Gemmatimonadota bacterium]